MNQDIEDVTPKGEEKKKRALVVDDRTRLSPGAAKLGTMLAAMEATVAASGIADFNARLEEQKRLRKEAKRQKALQDFNKPVLTKAEQEKAQAHAAQ